MPAAMESTPTPTSRAEQRELARARKMARPHAPLVVRAKQLWEIVRQRTTPDDTRRAKCTELITLLKGHVRDILFKHDASRIVQTAVKHGTPAERNVIASELEGCYLQLAHSKYGRFIVAKILAYCAPHRAAVIRDFNGNIRTAIRHRDASQVLEEVFSQYANASQRTQLLQEFYGPEYAVFKQAESPLAQPDLPAAKRTAILKHLRAAIEAIVDKQGPAIGPLSIVHRVLLEYVSHASATDIVAITDILTDILVHIVHTRDGARVFQLCMVHATPKQRKLILRSLKGFVTKIAVEQYAHAALISVFDCVDDTVLVTKTVLSELTADSPASNDIPSFSEVVRNRYGSRVIHFLLSGRNRNMQHAYVINELEATDSVRALTSKKDPEIRARELLNNIKFQLLTVLTETCGEVLRSANSASIIVEILHRTCANPEDDKTKALIEKLLDSIATCASDFDCETFDTVGIEDEEVKRKDIVSDADKTDYMSESSTESDTDDDEEEEEDADEDADSDVEEDEEEEEEDEDDVSEKESNASSSASEEEDDDDDEIVVKTASGSTKEIMSKMQEEARLAKLLADGINMSIPVLRIPQAAISIKEMIGGRSPASRPVPQGDMLCKKLVECLSYEQVMFLLSKCAKEPLVYSKLSFLFVVIAEVGGRGALKLLLKNKTGKLDLKAYSSLMDDSNVAEKNSVEKKNKSDGKQPPNKRRNVTATESSPVTRRAVIKMFLEHVKP